MKKIAIIYPAYYKEVSGGAELQLSYLCQAAMNEGWTVHYIFVPIKNVSSSNTEILHPIPRFQNRALFFRYGKSISCELNRINPDIIITRHSSSWIYFAANWAERNKVPHVHAIASDYFLEMCFSFRKLMTPFKLIEETFVRCGIRKCRHFIAQNEFQKKSIENVFRKQCILISQMTPSFPKEKIIKEKSPVIILWIANFKSLKRPETFLRLAEHLESCKTATKYKLVMCGRAPGIYADLVRDAQKRLKTLEYLGELSQNEVNHQLLKGHILVNTSIYEGFSNTFVQAWMRKVPVISMNSDPDHTLSEKGLGALAPTEEELFRQTLRLIEDEALRNEIGERAYEYALEHHSLEKNMPKLLQYLDSLS